MKIRLDNEWFIEEDGSGYTLRKWTGKMRTHAKTGEQSPVYEFENYPPSIDSCLRHYVRNKVVEQNEELTLKEYVEAIETLYAGVSEALLTHHVK